MFGVSCRDNEEDNQNTYVFKKERSFQKIQEILIPLVSQAVACFVCAGCSFATAKPTARPGHGTKSLPAMPPPSAMVTPASLMRSSAFGSLVVIFTVSTLKFQQCNVWHEGSFGFDLW